MAKKKKFLIRATAEVVVFTYVKANSAAEAEDLVKDNNKLHIIYTDDYKPQIEDFRGVMWCFSPLITGTIEQDQCGLNIEIKNSAEL